MSAIGAGIATSPPVAFGENRLALSVPADHRRAYATAAFAMGDTARAWIERLHGYEALAVVAADRSWSTGGFATHLPIADAHAAPPAGPTP